MVIFGERMKVIYMKRLRKLRQWVRYGKPSIYGYTLDQDVYVPVTEEDFESVTVLDSPAVVGLRRRWDRFKPNRKATGY